MRRQLNYLPFLILACMVGLGAVGCTQSDDIVTPVTSTEITLEAQRLPALPNDMIYELWVADSRDAVSLGKFWWDDQARTFLDSAGNARSSTFVLDGDLLSYLAIFVSVENIPDTNGNRFGPIMLYDVVTNPADQDIQLQFPQFDSLWQALVYFNVQTASDSSPNTSGNGRGIWLSRYAGRNFLITDTVAISWTDSVYEVSIPPNDSLRYPCSVAYDSVITQVVEMPGCAFTYRLTDSGHRDTLRHTFVKWQRDMCTSVNNTADTMLDTITQPIPSFVISTHSYIRDEYDNSQCILPNISQFGWKYRAWVMTPNVDTADLAAKWKFTAPFWQYKLGGGVNYIPGDAGYLFPVCSFDSLFGPSDDGSPYSLPGITLPCVPGTDFIYQSAMQATFGIDSLQVLPAATGNVGSVLLTVEPTNYSHDTTNFPLIVAVGNLSSVVKADRAFYALRPFVRALKGDNIGFPTIYTSVKRY